MAPYAGAAGGTAPVTSQSVFHLQKGDSMYVIGQLAAGATQLPIAENNVAIENFPLAVQASAPVCILQDGGESNTPPMVNVEIHFPGAPGAGETIEIQESDTDADAFYITPSNATFTITSFNAATNNARADLSPIGGKFLRARRTKGANAVGCWVKFTRMA